MKSFENIMLLDSYGSLLTEKQYTVMDMYLNDDMSLSEIGDSLGITRQAVRDNISRTLTILKEYEEKLKFVAKFQDITHIAGEVKVELQNLNLSREYSSSSINRCIDLVQNIIDIELQE